MFQVNETNSNSTRAEYKVSLEFVDELIYGGNLFHWVKVTLKINHSKPESKWVDKIRCESTV
jgi:hypothetical protein